MKRKFYTSYVYDSWSGEKIFDNTIVLLDVAENDEKKIPVLLQRKLSKKINDRTTGRFFPVTLINFWEID
jgi:hypothetical protein